MRGERPQFDFKLIHTDTRLSETLDEIRILFVVDGTCHVKKEERKLILSKSDYLLINVLEEADVQLDSDSYLAILSLPYFDLLQASDRISIRFECCSLDGKQPQYAELFQMLQGLLMCFVGDRREERLKATGLYYLLLAHLIANFSRSPDKIRQTLDHEEKITQIMQYIWENYRQEISMTEIAEKVFLSRSVASRLFKQTTGENFPDYLKKLRLSGVRKALEQSDLSVTQIALEYGFSSPSVLNRTFREKMGMSPLEYRRNFLQKNTEDPQKEADMAQIRRILESNQKLGLEGKEEVHSQTIRLEDAVRWNPWKNRLLNVGAFSSLLSARMQRQIAFLTERLNIEYLRIWNPFASDMMMLGEEKGRFNFSLLDEVLDFCVDHHVKVFIDLTPRRERNMGSENREIDARSSREYFETQEDWLHAIRAFVSHIKTRYQEQTVSQWIMELTFSLNDIPYYSDTEYSVSAAWNQSYQTIKEILPKIRIAGPGYIPDSDPQYDEEQIHMFLSLCQHQPDVFTMLSFPYNKVGMSIYDQSLIKDATRNIFYQQASRIREILTDHHFKGEFWITECGISVVNRNYIQDSCYRGATMLEQMLAGNELADSIGVFFGSDLIGAFSDSAAEICGSGGLLSRSGIRKPIYYAYRFLRQMGDRRLLNAAKICATCFHPGDIRIVCWNRKNLGPRYYTQPEDSFRLEQIEQIMDNLDPYVMELKIVGLEEGKRYRIRQRVMNEESGSALHKWMKLGCSETLSRDDLEYLYQTCTPEVLSEERILEGDLMRIFFRMAPNEMRMIQITKE
ncbi:MAG: helix-turn-helix domain-containing protein [Firmicutes bacterium]|nr:helix-turn-helix domain-containing protein [Bacillota bacterium]